VARRSGSTPRKNDSSARVLTTAAAADLIRATLITKRWAHPWRITAAAEGNAPEPFFPLSPIAA
jgi:hypothetical protein